MQTWVSYFQVEDVSDWKVRDRVRSCNPTRLGKGVFPMFDSLQEQIRSTEMDKHTISEQVLRWAGLLAITIVVFGAIYSAIRFLEY